MYLPPRHSQIFRGSHWPWHWDCKRQRYYTHSTLTRPMESVADKCTSLVEFRLVVFRPFKGEIIEGKISSSDNDGIKSMSPSRTRVAFPLTVQ